MYPFIFLSLFFQVFMLLNFFNYRKQMKKEEDKDKVFDFFPSITFMVPAWNEGKSGGIEKSVDSIENTDYPKDKIKIYIINNNSTDNTKEIVLDLINKYKSLGIDNIFYFFEEKQGKHNALNHVLPLIQTELVATLDADSTIDKNSIKILADYFKNSKIMSACSCMQILEPETIWQKIQSVEYALATFWRKSYSTIDAVQVMPGPLSVFRKEVFDNLGEYRSAYNAEDFEITIRMHRAGYTIANAHKAFVYTSGPSTLKGLYKQRIRWVRGFLSNAWDNRDMFFNRSYGNFGFFTLPVAFIFVFYSIYAISFSVFNLLKYFYLKIENYLFEPSSLVNTFYNIKNNINFDIFYFTTDMIMLQSVFLLTVLLYIIIISIQITDRQVKFFPNFFWYLFIFPYFIWVVIIVSIYKFVTGAKAVWALQDNKI